MSGTEHPGHLQPGNVVRSPYAVADDDMPRLTLDQLAAIPDATWLSTPRFATGQTFRVAIDSRRVLPGDIFWAIPGGQRNGHDFVPDAFERGASLAVVSRPESVPQHGAAIVVPDVITALAQLADAHRTSWDGMPIGITGSVGKTSTREMLHAILSTKFPGVRSPANFNNDLGVPLTLLNIVHGRDEYAITELAATGPGEIARLCRLARPEAGIITAIGLAHAGRFGSQEAIVKAKSELVASLPEGGLCILPGDDPSAAELAAATRTTPIFVGTDDTNTLPIRRWRLRRDGWMFELAGCDYLVRTPARHLAKNAALAIALALNMGLDPREIAEGLASWSPMTGRCQIRTAGSLTVIDDSYNASPTAVAAALHLLDEFEPLGRGRKLAVLGDMAELGPLAEREHLRLGQLAAGLSLDWLLAYGDHAETIARGATTVGMAPHRLVCVRDLETLWTLIDCWVEADDIVLVKGSRALKLEIIVDRLLTLGPQLQPNLRRSA